MIFGVLVNLAVGLLCVVLGLLVWKKRKISLLHDYHYQYVKQEDIPAYTRQMGIGLVIVGAGIASAGIFDLFLPSLWWAPLAAGIILGLIVIIMAQRKYNRSETTEK